MAVTERRVLRSEWIKLRSVRSTVLGLAGAAASLVTLGALFSWFAGSDDQGPSDGNGDSLVTSLGGMVLVQLVVGVLGVLFVSSEYGSGMIRATLAAVSSRTSILRAKTVVLSVAVLVVMTIGSVAAFLVGNAIYGGSGSTYSLTEPDVLLSLLGGGVYAAGVGALGVALGFLLRSAAGGIGVLVALLLVAPLMVQLVPGSIGDWISKLLPGNAGQAILHMETQEGQLSPGIGLAVFAAWIVAALVAAGIVLNRRDA
jgi:ABC-type transport system involved in multi-copper enzyme maturation permease subunit